MQALRVIDLRACTLSFLTDDVVHAHFKDGMTGAVTDLKEMFAAIARERGGHKALLMVSFGDQAALTNDARNYASGEDSNRHFAADAIIVRDFGHQMSANAFVRVNKPQRPIRLFPDEESAMAWLLEQRGLIT
ncbi:MAG: hypothetical protein JNL05_00360 [Flavobacteriales bacterium]|nr:hypothetical protein [Flavobacteriales bacterium]